MDHPVWGKLTKKYTERGCDVYLAESGMWVIIHDGEVIGATYENWNNNGLSAEQNVSGVIEYYANPEKLKAI